MQLNAIIVARLMNQNMERWTEMLDKNGILASLLKTMRQQATANFCQLLRDIADELECDSEPLEEMVNDSIMLEFDAMWQDR